MGVDHHVPRRQVPVLDALIVQSLQTSQRTDGNRIELGIGNVTPLAPVPQGLLAQICGYQVRRGRAARAVQHTDDVR